METITEPTRPILSQVPTETLYTALLKSQTEFPNVKKSANNPFFKSKYASLDAILEVVTPILNKNGLFIVQIPVNDDGRIGVYTKIFYKDGECVSGSFTMTLAKNDPQGAGSAITYARRYALVSMLGLNVEDDDDANHASAKQPVTINYKEVKEAVDMVSELGF